jgi:CHAT domain-containing protein
VALGQQLYQDLLGWPEIESRLSQTELLYIVPDDFFYEIPFSTLMANRSETQTFLANRTAVLSLPSATLLANPNFADGVHERHKTPKVLMSVDKRFPGAEQFVAKVKTLFPLADELAVADSSFTKEAVLAQLQKDYPIYIFLGHGQANPQNSDYGYMELSVGTPQAPAAKVIRLTVADLKTIDWLGAEMVMLVGCETASGRLYRGTGIAGLQQEFLSLGAKNVLGNLWEVDAAHAISQAQAFLTAWVTTWNPSRALQESQRQAIETLQENRYYQQPHPYFWGNAVLLTAQSQ